MAFSAILNVKLVTRELVQFAGNHALMASEMMELSASSPNLMEEELGMSYGKRINAKKKTLKDVKRMVSYGTQNASLDSMLLDAAFAHQIASMDKLILEFHVLRKPMEELLVNHLPALVILNSVVPFAILVARMVTRVLAQFAGDLALLDILHVELFA